MIPRYILNKKCVDYDVDVNKVKIYWYICYEYFVNLLDDDNNIWAKFLVILWKSLKFYWTRTVLKSLIKHSICIKWHK